MASSLASHSRDKHETTLRLEITKPMVVGMNRSKGDKVLRALIQLQTKLNNLQTIGKNTTVKLTARPSASSDGHDDGRGGNGMTKNQSDKSTLTSAFTNDAAIGDDENDGNDGNDCNESEGASSDGNRYEMIETRLQIIEKQLQFIINNVLTQNDEKVDERKDNRKDNRKDKDNHLQENHKHKDPEMVNGFVSKHNSTVDYDNRNHSDTVHNMVHKSCECLTKCTKSDDRNGISLLSKNKFHSDSRLPSYSRHYHIQQRDIPFILGTSTRSHSVIAQKQNEIFKLKQHNELCNGYAKGYRNTHKTNELNESSSSLDYEIKELLYDLQEEHNYIADEIRHLSGKLESATDMQKKSHLQRELYFLSRRIMSKKKQIAELQELYSTVMHRELMMKIKNKHQRPSKVTFDTNQFRPKDHCHCKKH